MDPVYWLVHCSFQVYFMFRPRALVPTLLGLYGILLGLSPIAHALETDGILAQKQNSSQTWPGNRVGGGTRSDFCSIVVPENANIQRILDQGALPLKLVAIMPENNLGETTLAYPRLVWYIPATEARYAELVLEKMGSSDGDPRVLIYRMGFRINGQGGIHSMVIPRDAAIPPLDADESYYKWTLRLYCQSDEETIDPWFDTEFDFSSYSSVSGSIYRSDVAPRSLTLATPDLLKQAEVDLNQGLWFDALDKVFDRYCQVNGDPVALQQFQENWTSLLDSVGLGLLSDQPIHLHCESAP